MHRSVKFLTSIPRIGAILSVVCLIGVTALVFVESVVRTTVGVSVTHVFEVGGIGLLCLVFLGLGWLYQEGAHLRVGFAVDRLPAKPLRILNLFLHLLSLAFVVFAVKVWWDMTMATLESGRFYLLSQIPVWPVQMVGVVGWGIMGLAILESIVKQGREIMGKPVLDRDK